MQQLIKFHTLVTIHIIYQIIALQYKKLHTKRITMYIPVSGDVLDMYFSPDKKRTPIMEESAYLEEYIFMSIFI